MAVKLSVGLCSIDLTQKYLTLRPGQIENAIRDPLILIFFDQS